jgi:hemoglobin
MQDIVSAGWSDRAPLGEASLAVVLDRFYAKARQDPALGPVFAAAIADESWPEHMARIAGFWRSVLFKTGDYKGNPFGAHLRLPGLTPALFARWLQLFGETCREVLGRSTLPPCSTGRNGLPKASRPGSSSGPTASPKTWLMEGPAVRPLLCQ